MATCPRCKAPVLSSTWCGEPVFLDTDRRVFATLEPFGEDPTDGVKVFAATYSYAEHRCVDTTTPASLPPRTDGTPQPLQRHAAKKRVTP